MTSTCKRLTLCADDFTLNDSVSEGILELLAQQRLSATSCMVDSPLWPTYAQPLKAFKGIADIGLHLNFTEAFPSTPARPLTEMMWRSLLRQLKPQAIAQDIKRQLDRFEDHWNAAPDFIDGHQHVHQFPVIREALISEIKQRYGDHPPYVRSLQNIINQGSTTKILALNLMGAKTFGRQLTKAKIPFNSGFSGLYDFNPQANYRALMQSWLQQLPEQGLMMCHPANPGVNDGTDSIAAARKMEFKYLSSKLFEEDLAEARVLISPLFQNT